MQVLLRVSRRQQHRSGSEPQVQLLEPAQVLGGRHLQLAALPLPCHVLEGRLWRTCWYAATAGRSSRPAGVCWEVHVLAGDVPCTKSDRV